MSNTEIRNAKIRSTFLGIEDHGILTAFLQLDYGGSGQGFGGYGFDEWVESERKRVGVAYGMEWIRRVLETLGVDKWESLPGTHCRVKHTNSKIDSIGHIIEDKWFSPEDLYEFMLKKKKAA